MVDLDLVDTDGNAYYYVGETEQTVPVTDPHKFGRLTLTVTATKEGSGQGSLEQLLADFWATKTLTLTVSVTNAAATGLQVRNVAAADSDPVYSANADGYTKALSSSDFSENVYTSYYIYYALEDGTHQTASVSGTINGTLNIGDQD